MTILKSISRSATVAFSPTASVMAVGTMAGAIDSSFSSSASLELLPIDFSDPGQELSVAKCCPTLERFNRLSWGNHAVGSEEYPLGIIAGSLADGAINLWNPGKLLSEDGVESEQTTLPQLERHSGAVRGLEFSVLAPNLLASGGDDGHLYIWDLKDPTAPIHYPPLRGGGKISYVSWNRKVQPILAATSDSGTCVVWDLRKAKPVLSFTDPSSQRRYSTLQWNPENATQLILSPDDDKLPSLQVWDLRNSVSPLKEFVGHTKGVLAMTWCPIDTSLLLTCAKDNLTLCWDTSSGEILCEIPAGNNWNFDVQWSPRTPGVLSTSSYDGNISLYNIEACSPLPDENIFGREIGRTTHSYAKKAPKWLKRPVGVSFGFGGKVVSFGPSKKVAPGVAGPSLSEIHLHSVVTEDELVKQSSEFESAISGGEKPVLRAFCDNRANIAGNEKEKETWTFLKVMFEDDARRKLLTHLNFDVIPTDGGDAEESDQKGDESEEVADIKDEVPAVEAEPPVSLADDTLQLGEAEAGEDFFDNIQTPKTPDEDLTFKRLEDLTIEGSTKDEGARQDHEIEAEGADEYEKAVQRALVVGDFKSAVQHCLAANNAADALILAYVGGSTLWETTQNEYTRKSGRSYLKILSAVVNNDLKSLVERRPLKAWKETLALLCTYARSEDWTVLSDALAARLDAANETQAATLCYICSGNIVKAGEIWSRSLETVSGGRNYVEALQTLMEKVVVLSLATGQKRLSASLGRLVKQYAELLVSQGLLVTAQEYLSLVPAEEASLELVVLKDRIYGSGASDDQSDPPTVPWERQPLRVELPASPVHAQSVYPPTENTSYFQATQPFQPDSHGILAEPNQRPYPPTENASYYTKSDAQNFTPSMPYQNFVAAQQGRAPPMPVFMPASPIQQSQSPSGPGAPPQVQNPQSNNNTWYPRGSNPSHFVPSMPTQTFPPAQQQPYPPIVSSVNYTPAQQTFTPAQQTFTPTTFNPPQKPFTPAQPGPAQSFVPAPQPFVPAVPLQQPYTPVQPVPAPSPQTTFMPASPKQQLSTPGVGGTPGQPQVNTAPAPVAPPAPAPTVQNVDTSNVSAELKPVVAILTRLYNETSEAVGGIRANPAKKREIDNNSRKLGALFLKLNSADISANAASKLVRLCQALDVGDYATALQIQVGLTTSDWDECSIWLAALKQMIKTRQTLR